jgi:uncharacterized membrane protein YcaP (DUF421 family)
VVILGFDIGAALTPDVSLFETVVRGIVVYFGIFLLLRVVLRGRTSAVTVSDLLVLVLIADAAQNAMATSYLSITNGLVLVATLVFCSVAVDWLAFHYPVVRHFVHPERKPLVIDGRIIRKSLKEELMTEGELLTQLRLNGADAVEEVKSAYLEGNGEISVIKFDPGEVPKREAKRGPAQAEGSA